MRAPLNFLVIMADQQRADWLGGSDKVPLRTPHVDGLRARGLTFTNATTPSPVCAPARACLATARDYDRGFVANNNADLPADAPTYYQALTAGGYHVAGVGKLDLHKPTHYWGLDGSYLLAERGFSAGSDNEGKLDAVRFGWPEVTGPYMAYLAERGLAQCHADDVLARHLYVDTHPTPLPDDAYHDNWVAGRALAELARCPRDRPWHLLVNFSGPHNPMDVTAGMQERLRDVHFAPPFSNRGVPPEVHDDIRRNYAAMIENIDGHVGALLAQVEERGESDRTVIVYTADHGDMLGDHDLWGKTTFYHPSVAIPFVVATPSTVGAETRALVSLEDIAATVLDLAGLQPMAGATACSFRQVLEGAGAHRQYLVSGLVTSPSQRRQSAEYAACGAPPLPANWRMIYDGQHKLVVAREGPLALFDLDVDPHECDDLRDARPEIVTDLYRLLLDDVGRDWSRRFSA